MEKPKYLEISKEDLEKVAKVRIKNEQKVKVDEEWLAIAEFGKHYGWSGVMAIINNEIDSETFAVLLSAGRKLEYRSMFNDAQTTLIGVAAANSKKPSQVFDKATKGLIREMKVD